MKVAKSSKNLFIVYAIVYLPLFHIPLTLSRIANNFNKVFEFYAQNNIVVDLEFYDGLFYNKLK